MGKAEFTPARQWKRPREGQGSQGGIGDASWPGDFLMGLLEFKPPLASRAAMQLMFALAASPPFAADESECVRRRHLLDSLQPFFVAMNRKKVGRIPCFRTAYGGQVINWVLFLALGSERRDVGASMSHHGPDGVGQGGLEETPLGCGVFEIRPTGFLILMIIPMISRRSGSQTTAPAHRLPSRSSCRAPARMPGIA